jgi:hypothetical protein
LKPEATVMFPGFPLFCIVWGCRRDGALKGSKGDLDGELHGDPHHRHADCDFEVHGHPTAFLGVP